MAGQHKPETTSKDVRPPPAEEPEWLLWKSERGAAKELGTSSTYLRKLATRLELEPYRAPDGTNRYSPSLVSKFRKHIDTANELAEDVDLPATSEKPVTEGDLLKTMSAALVQANAHNARLLNIICGPVERMLCNYDGLLERLQSRNETLENARDASQAAREESIERMHERELETAIVKSGLERKDKLFGQLEKRMPMIFEKLEKSFLLKDERVSGATSATLDFLKTLEPMQVGALLHPQMTILSPEQQKLVRKIFEEAGLPVPSLPSEPEPEPKKETPPNGHSE